MKPKIDSDAQREWLKSRPPGPQTEQTEKVTRPESWEAYIDSLPVDQIEAMFAEGQNPLKQG